jgi:hypothetical protein
MTAAPIIEPMPYDFAGLIFGTERPAGSVAGVSVSILGRFTRGWELMLAVTSVIVSILQELRT